MTIIAIVMTTFSGDIRTSQEGLKLIGNAEGCKAQPYLCPAGVMTVGVGSTTGNIEPGKKYSDEEIAKRWVSDIKEAEQCVNQFANGKGLPQGTFDAFTSITFNVGCTAMKKSTLFKYSRSGKIKDACFELTRWVYAGGKKLPGLVTRRDGELHLCLRDLK
ncbi:lysozyme [Jinshanibacter sp. LJY008]|uniref:Lysozyme n=1 Tax=Limnobaculum eriocheiris TaxID=2897391 RepID=A0A9X1MTP1_9GAMM|nr:lysozyme [Limnobaculum eriocheiris]MCD1124829.1 lysozyme [Limnobaculum eriocheiris]